MRRDCGRLAFALQALCVGLVLLILLESFGPWLVRHPDGPQVAIRLIGLVAPLVYLAGLWRLAGVLKIYATTGRFLAARALRGVGLALTAGGVFEVAVVPGLDALAGHGPGYVIGLDPAAIVLAALGVALLMFARLFKRAARMEAELETIL
ncbi:MAG: DUF2975 domain-containing protein [Asticcacaulis sp.]